MECRKCKCDLTDKEHKMVAHWPFCLSCFTGMMEAPKVSVSVEASTSVTPETICQLCSKSVLPEECKKVGIWLFCKECYGDMNASPFYLERKKRKEEEEQAELEEQLPREPLVIDTIAFTKCSGCGRRIQERGAKEVEGRQYCPDCFFADESADRPTMPFSSSHSSPSSPVRSSAIDYCQSCENTVGPENLQIAGGFHICSACMVTDAELAVELAKDRHRKRMLQMKAELS